MNATATENAPSLFQGRLCILLAALLWSTSGAFTKVLTKETPLHLNEPPFGHELMACLRGLFAGLVLLPTLRRRDLSFRPLMLLMAACFAVMNLTFIAAMALGTAANAIVLQYTAPTWMYLASVWWLGEAADRRNLAAVGIGLLGVLVIVAGGWQSGELDVVLLGLTSGLGYAAVLICLRVLRGKSSRWLAVVNLLSSGLVLLPFVIHSPMPSGGQLVVMAFYGGAQMGIPYWLVARGLRTVSPQEAGTLLLLEPLLNPVWTYLLSGEEPPIYVLLGGLFILGALAWRYWPRRQAELETKC